MELQLKHVAAYFGHAVKVEFSNGSGLKKVGTLNAISHYEDATHPTRLKMDYGEYEHIWLFKLILKPIGKLTKEELLQAGFRTHIDFLTHELQSPTCTHKIEDAPHKMVEYLLSQHYDIFGLFYSGLAIEKTI